MKIQVALLLVCGILSVIGSPVEKADKSENPEKVEKIEKNEKIDEIDKIDKIEKNEKNDKIESIEQDSSDKKFALSEKLLVASNEKVDSSEKSISSEKLSLIEKVDSIDKDALKEKLSSDKKQVNGEKLDASEKPKLNEKLAFEKKLASSEKSKAIEAIKSLQSIESQKSTETLEGDDSSSSESVESEEVAKQSPIDELHSIIQTVIVESSSYREPEPAINDASRKIGPVELGLRNAAATSAAITEQIYFEMTAINAETSHMINSKSEILTAHAMNELFTPLSKVENEIKKTQGCGQRFEQSLNFIFTDIDISLKQCIKNLTAIDEHYRHVNVGSLTSLSIISQDMSHLPKSCEISQNFAAGTFCIVNNMAELNERAVSDVRTITENTKIVLEKTEKAVEAAEMCQSKLVEKVTEKLNKLSKDVHEKCIDRKE